MSLAPRIPRLTSAWRCPPLRHSSTQGANSTAACVPTFATDADKGRPATRPWDFIGGLLMTGIDGVPSAQACQETCASRTNCTYYYFMEVSNPKCALRLSGWVANLQPDSATLVILIKVGRNVDG